LSRTVHAALKGRVEQRDVAVHQGHLAQCLGKPLLILHSPRLQLIQTRQNRVRLLRGARVLLGQVALNARVAAL
jgi:hypothetical protein